MCWHFDLLPRWALAVLAAREVFMLVPRPLRARRGFDLKVNWLGRAGVWPVMSRAVLRHGRARDWVARRAASTSGWCWRSAATAQYVRDGARLRAQATLKLSLTARAILVAAAR